MAVFVSVLLCRLSGQPWTVQQCCWEWVLVGYAWTTSGGQGEAKDPSLSSLKRSLESSPKAASYLFVGNHTYEIILTTDFKLVIGRICHPWISQSAPVHFYTWWRFPLRLRLTDCVLADELASEGVRPVWRWRRGWEVSKRPRGSTFPSRICLRGKKFNTLPILS